MKKFISIFFLVVFVMVTFQDMSFYIVFKLNQEFLTQKFCVNKQKKDSKCKATCHFNKQVKKAKSNSEKQNIPSTRFEIALIAHSNEQNKEYNELDIKAYSDFLHQLIDTYSFKIYKPPQFIS